ncbi:MAG TPA: alpha/beta hydrolase domain-containing protein [Acidobacteriaceae bacterium]|jgi:hypothetical protein|nr:alpha/beta hydrolase domain-containing protein [Acidobacteriaceae bacterium]
MIHTPRRLASVLLTIIALTLPARARVTSITVLTRTPVLNNQPFGPAGPYEEITARVNFAVRPADPHNRIIVDLDRAPRNSQGEVEFSADLFLLRPVNGGNHALLLEIPNRGAKGIMRIVDGGTPAVLPATPENFGDAWLLDQGFTYAALGWQWDAPDLRGNLRLYAPVATDHGRPITGLLRDDFTTVVATRDWPLGHIIEGRVGGTEYPAMNPADPRNVLTVRTTPDGPRTTIPKTDWGFTNPGAIHLNSGFQPGRIYELVYTVQNPIVAGLGFAAVRDFVSWLKSPPASTPAPIAPVTVAYAAGISQCGRFLRDFLYEGFNQDESSRMALDGVLAHVGGAGRGSFNYRFAQPSRDAQPMSSIFWPTDIFPFTDQSEQDPAHPSAAPQGLLDRARAEHDVPKIFLSHTSYEYWGRAASLIHTTADGKRDVLIGPNVRIYFFTGLQHFSGPFPPQKGRGQLASQNLQSFLPIRWFWRAMIANMNAWVQQGTAPPPSSYPQIADGTLVPRNQLTFPVIPGIHPPDNYTEAFHLDFGPDWQTMRILTLQPPIVGSPFPILFPQVDKDGNAEAGIHLPEITVPLATYTGWNLRDPGTGAPEERVSFLGSWFPFAKTEAERNAEGDPRLSIAERYSGREDYLDRYKKAVDDLVGQHWILPQDAADLIKQGAAEWDYSTK